MTGRSLLAGSFVAALTATLVACSGGSNSADPIGTAPPPNAPPTGSTGCTGSCVSATSFLTTADIGTIISQAVAEAQAQNSPATIAVVDRVGNVLGVYRMNGARPTVTITSNRGVQGGLENVAVPSELAAISKAVTGAYLSSEGNAFSTRSASQIVQEHFNPGESNAPSGPLFGVQFSQLICSDLITLGVPALDILMTAGARTVGPKPAPLGLSADPGGFPLYKAGTPVGGIGVIANDTYTLDPRVLDRDRDVDELIAWAGTFNFSAPLDVRGDRITADAKTFRFSDIEFSDLARAPGTAPGFATLGGAGALFDVPFFFVAANGLRTGTVFTSPESGIRADTGTFQPQDAFILVDGNNQNRYPPRAGTDGAGALTAAEVTEVMRQALNVANRARAQIRRPTNSQMRVTISVVDTNGAILGVVRTRDAPVFGTDVSLQKARTAAFFSGEYAADDLRRLPPAVYANGTIINFTSYLSASQAFFGIQTIFDDGAYAFTPRAIGNIARPFYPDGVQGTQNGPLSKPFPAWSPFTDGIQYDLINNATLSTVAGYTGIRDGQLNLGQALELIPIGSLPPALGPRGCVGFTSGSPTVPSPVRRIDNGIQIFPGASPIYRGNQLVGAIGISGDGIDQDDMVSFLGLENGSDSLGGSIDHAPPEMRADRLVPQGARLRYVQCPQGPFLNSTEQNVCEGI